MWTCGQNFPVCVSMTLYKELHILKLLRILYITTCFYAWIAMWIWCLRMKTAESSEVSYQYRLSLLYSQNHGFSNVWINWSLKSRSSGQHGALKRWYPTTTLHGVTTQKTSLWNITAVKASKLKLEPDHYF